MMHLKTSAFCLKTDAISILSTISGKRGKNPGLPWQRNTVKIFPIQGDGKTVYIGSDWRDITYGGEKKKATVRIVYEIIERTTDKYGQFLLEPELEVNTFWTNLDLSDEDVIANYHAHGQCEQYHSELKTDMDLERLPSGKFETNELIPELAILAFNILRMIGQEALGTKIRDSGHCEKTEAQNRDQQPG